MLMCCVSKREREINCISKLSNIGDRLLIGTGVGQLLVYDTKEPLCKYLSTKTSQISSLYWVLGQTNAIILF